MNINKNDSNSVKHNFKNINLDSEENPDLQLVLDFGVKISFRISNFKKSRFIPTL